MATFKIKDIEDSARLILLDTYEDAYRFEPKEIFQAIHDACKHTRSVRPESCYVNGRLVDLDFPTIPQTGEPDLLYAFRNSQVNMEERWREAIIYYVVFKMYMKDDADTVNLSLSEKYLSLYNAEVAS